MKPTPQFQQSYDEHLMNYARYRGRCKELAEAACKADATLRLVRGHYLCPMWGKQAHWWCVKPDGTVVDPSVLQFPTRGVAAEYEEFDGMCECAECGKRVPEAEATFESRYAFCSGKCLCRFVGL